jgi:hypothetical protein
MTGDNEVANALVEFAKAKAARRAAKVLAELQLYDDASSRISFGCGGLRRGNAKGG